MNRNQLDEMQQQMRNKIGNRSFFILIYLLLIDIALYGFGVRWLQYPVNVFVLLLVAMTYYTIRSILSNALIGPGITARRQGIKATVVFIISAVAANICTSILLKNNVRLQWAGADGYGAIILFAFSCIAVIAIIITCIISYYRNRSVKE